MLAVASSGASPSPSERADFRQRARCCFSSQTGLVDGNNATFADLRMPVGNLALRLVASAPVRSCGLMTIAEPRAFSGVTTAAGDSLAVVAKAGSATRYVAHRAFLSDSWLLPFNNRSSHKETMRVYELILLPAAFDDDDDDNDDGCNAYRR